MIVRIVCIVLFYLISVPVIVLSQNEFSIIKEDTLLARQYIKKATNFERATQIDSSIYFFEKAKTIYIKLIYNLKNKRIIKDVIFCNRHIGRNLVRKRKFEDAKEYFDESLKIGFSKLGENTVAVSNIYSDLGTLYYMQTDYDNAFEYYNKAFQIRIEKLGDGHNRVANSYNNMGMIYDRKGDYRKAIEHYNKSMEIKTALFGIGPQLRNTFFNIGIAYDNLGDYDKALKFYQKALDVRIHHFGNNHPAVAYTYTNIGNVFYRKGDYDNALQYYKQALNIRLAVFGDMHPSVSFSYNNIGMIYYEKSDFEKALEYYNNALKIKLETLGEKHQDIATTYNNLGIVYVALRNYDKAIEFYTKALDIRKQKFGEDHLYTSTCLLYLGDAYESMREYDKALEYYNYVIDITSDIHTGKHPKAAEAYQKMAAIYLKKNKLLTALKFSQKAIIALNPEFNDSSIYKNPNLDNIINEKELFAPLKAKAETFRKLFINNHHNIEYLEASYENYQLTIKLVDLIRSSYKSESAKLLLGEGSAQVFDDAIQVALKLFDITKKEIYKNEAFVFAEKNKASILLSSLQELNAKKFAGIPDSLIDYEKQLKIDLTYIDTKLQKLIQKKGDLDEIKLADLEEKRFYLNTAYQQLLKEYENNYSEYYQLKYDSKTYSISEIQQSIENNSVILEYFVGENRIHCFVISRNLYDIVSINIDSSFIDFINSYTKSIKKININKYLKLSEQVYKLIFRPLTSAIHDFNKIIIIPHGILLKLPFESLISTVPQNFQAIDLSKLDYLINKYDISYHYSVNLYIQKLGHYMNQIVSWICTDI